MIKIVEEILGGIVKRIHAKNIGVILGRFSGGTMGRILGECIE